MPKTSVRVSPRPQQPSQPAPDPRITFEEVIIGVKAGMDFLEKAVKVGRVVVEKVEELRGPVTIQERK